MSPHDAPFSAAVIGGGPAGLMAAEVLREGGAHVDVFDAMPSFGRKFLLAGVGGMNITHAEPHEQFIARYRDREQEIAALLTNFDATTLREWIHALGIETFVGSSGRVFPKDMKAAPLLRAWLHRLRESGVRLHTRHRWLGWKNEALHFATPAGEIFVRADCVVLALGGGSWKKLGSDGSWVSLLRERNVDVATLQPSNCGFDVAWSEHFRQRFAGAPLKSVAATVINGDNSAQRQLGECVITATGIEGGLIYSCSALLRERILATGSAQIRFDLAPDRSLQQIIDALSRPRGSDSIANHLRKRLHIDGVKAGLLRECVPAQDFNDPTRLAAAIKALPITLSAMRPLDEAISSAGGVRFSALDDRLMLRALPGVFCAGEMLDWEASTGGYLLTACFASGRAAGQGALAWSHERIITADESN